MAGDGRHVMSWSPSLVKAEEEDGVLPCGTGHERGENVCYLCLTVQNGLTRARMLIINARTGLDERETGQGTVREIGEERRKWSDMIRIDAEGVRRSPTTLDFCVVPVQAARVGFS